MEKRMEYADIPKEKFEFYKREEEIRDKRLETKPVGYFKDAMMRFCRNKSSVIAACVLVCLVLFAVFVPIFCQTTYSSSPTDTNYLLYTKFLPKCKWFAWAGWDGCSKETLNASDYLSRRAIGVETGMDPIVKVYRENYEDPTSTVNTTYYDVKTDSYIKNGMIYLTLTPAEYESIQDWQNETGIQVIYPAVDNSGFLLDILKNNANIWYECTQKGAPKLDRDGNFIPLYKTTGNDGEYHSLRIQGDDGSYRYAVATGTSTAVSYKVRVFTYTYFQYRYGFEPSFLFGTNALGHDILTRLAGGFCLLLAFR